MMVHTLQGSQTFPTSDRYTDLIVISSATKLTLEEHELLARGKEHERLQQDQIKKELEKIQIDQLFRSSFGKSSRSGTSVVSGVAGIGKSTMVQKLVHDWAAGEIYPQFQFVFHFRFRDLNVIDGRTSLKAMVLDSYPYLHTELKHVWEVPENLLFIFDGLDEFKDTIDFTDIKRNTEAQYHCFETDCMCEVSDIVRCLIQQKLLQGCSVLVTSRPTALESLDKAEVNLWAEILGFLADERKNYFRRFFGNEKLGDDVFKYVEESDIMYTMCFNPSDCGILCTTLEPFFKEPGGVRPIPRSITQLFSNYIYNIFKRHDRHDVDNPREVLLRAGELAYEGVSNRNIVFNGDHFHRHRLEPSKFISGFMKEILERDASAKSTVYTFQHLTIQEFVAALAQYLTPVRRNLLEYIDFVHRNNDGRFEIYVRFLWLKGKVAAEVRTPTPKDKLLNIFYYVFESEDAELAQIAGRSVDIMDFSRLTLNPLDSAVLSHVIQHSEDIQELVLNGCCLHAEGIKSLVSALPRVKVLRLQDNGLTAACIENLASSLNANRSLTELDLSDNQLGDLGVSQLSEALRNPDCMIQKLALYTNHLTDICLEGLASALSTNRSLTELELGRNSFTDQSFPDLLHLIQNCKSLKDIRLEGKRFSSLVRKHLKSLVESRAGLRVTLSTD
ncbi:NACHT, LRR and PYD domains-containing protein 12-like [Heptranchias perlo]|uniref:NACHT, LRR and PYD domains-containing protein 12-like n=1 Tax=Heptranchias perlo TaxID=212740 RepID=UPI00355AA746